MSSSAEFSLTALFTMMKPSTLYGVVFAVTDADGNVYYPSEQVMSGPSGTVRVSLPLDVATYGDAPIVQAGVWLYNLGGPFMEQALDRNGKPADADTVYPNAGYSEKAEDVQIIGGVPFHPDTAGYMK